MPRDVELDSIFTDVPRPRDFTMKEILKIYPTINTAPPYQRKPRQSQKNMCAILAHIMLRGFFLPIILYRLQDDEKFNSYLLECVDGQHRIFIVYNFMLGNIVTVRGKTFMLTWDYVDKKTHHVTRFFYEENPSTQAWIRSHPNEDFDYMNEKQKERFNEFRLSTLIFEERMTRDQRRITFLRLSDGVPVRNSDLYKNHTHLALISFITDTMGWSTKMTDCLEAHVTTQPIDYWLPWLIRFYMIHEGEDHLREFMVLDSSIVRSIKDNSSRFNKKPSDEFKDNVERFFAFMEDLPRDVRLNPCQFYALFAEFILYDSDKIAILAEKIPSWKGESRFAKLWQKDTKKVQMAERERYFSICISQLEEMVEPSPLCQGMSRGTYRKHMADSGHPLEADQDVCHIIAESNGGANHSDNYMILSSSKNRQVGNRDDSYFAKAVGLEKTKKAVAISIKICGYSGPSAEYLCA